MSANSRTLLPSPSMTLPVFLLGLLLASLGSCGIYLYREMHPESLESLAFLPDVTYEQSLSLCLLCSMSMITVVYHLHQLLVLLSTKMPVVPSSLPYFGQAPLFLKYSPWDLLLNWHRQLGPFFCFSLMGRTMVSVAHPEYLKIALQSKIRNVKKDVYFSYKPFLVILGHGIVTSENQSWMKQRLKMSTVLRVDVLDVIPRVTLRAIQRLMVHLDEAASNNTTIELGEALRHLTLQVISSTFLSLTADESDSTFAHMYLPIVEECNKRVWHPERAFCFFLPAFWKHQANIHRLNTYVSKLIRKRWAQRQSQQSAKDGDILDRVLDAYEKECPGQDLTPVAVEQFRDEMKTFMLAGHETSAAMMAWALYELMGDDHLMEEVAIEGESVFGKPAEHDWKDASDSELPPREELANLLTAEGCLKEALRKYSVVPLVTRRIVTPVDFGPHHVPAGFTMLINIQAVHHDPTYWPEPMKYDPHRFTDPDNRPAPYTFLPFIDGPRNCLGQHLALLESKIVLALLTQRYKFQMADGEKVETQLGETDKDPRHRYMVPIIPKKELRVIVSRRK